MNSVNKFFNNRVQLNKNKNIEESFKDSIITETSNLLKDYGELSIDNFIGNEIFLCPCSVPKSFHQYNPPTVVCWVFVLMVLQQSNHQQPAQRYELR